MVSNLKLTFVMIIALSFIPSAILCCKYILIMDNMQSIEVANSFDDFADKIESGSYQYSPNDLKNTFRNLAESERSIDRGLSKLSTGFKVWLGIIFLSSLANIYFLRKIYSVLRKCA